MCTNMNAITAIKQLVDTRVYQQQTFDAYDVHQDLLRMSDAYRCSYIECFVEVATLFRKSGWLGYVAVSLPVPEGGKMTRSNDRRQVYVCVLAPIEGDAKNADKLVAERISEALDAHRMIGNDTTKTELTRRILGNLLPYLLK